MEIAQKYVKKLVHAHDDYLRAKQVVDKYKSLEEELKGHLQQLNTSQVHVTGSDYDAVFKIVSTTSTRVDTGRLPAHIREQYAKPVVSRRGNLSIHRVSHTHENSFVP